MAAGSGPISELPTIPKHFASVEVGTMADGPGSEVLRAERAFFPAPGTAPSCCKTWYLLAAAPGSRMTGTVTVCAGPLPTRALAAPRRSPQEYVRVFEPLLLEECAAQMLRGQEEGQVLSAQPAVVAAAKARAEDESLLVRLTLPPDAAGGMHENDMVLVSRDNPEASSWFDDLCSKGGCCFLLGLEGGRQVPLHARPATVFPAGPPGR